MIPDVLTKRDMFELEESFGSAQGKRAMPESADPSYTTSVALCPTCKLRKCQEWSHQHTPTKNSLPPNREKKNPHRIRAPEILVAIDPHRCDSRSLQATGCWWRIKSGVAYKPQNGSMMDWSIRLWAKGLIFNQTGTSTSNGYHKSLWPAWSRLRHWRHPHRGLRRGRGGCRSGRRLGQGHPAWRNKKKIVFPTSTASTVLLSSSASQWLWLMFLTEFGS